MKKEDLILLWFNIKGFTYDKFKPIFNVVGNFEDFFDKNKFKNIFFKNINNDIINKFIETNLDNFEIDIEDKLNKFDVNFVTYFSNYYPKNLREIDEPPLVLYYKGNVNLLKEKTISIVGTRKPTTYGKIICEKFSKELSQAGLVTVSGLAYGIDTIVAESTINIQSKTIAVLAGGLDTIYPSQNTTLSKKIIENNGLLISEYFIGIKPLNYHFISRNRIIAGLGLGVLIVEAGKISGTLATARFALEQSKELFIIPGNINSPQSEGTNNLIDEMPDTFTISPNRILYKLNIKKNETPKSTKQVDMLENKILSFLEFEAMSFDDLCEKVNISPSELSSKLIKLEMFGMVKKANGNKYYRM